ncbi:tol-pal system-associated acyl-CoA thioesterase [Shimia sp. R9_1]|uniref:tol-pal system-associated acyl-CoA thioesterase n=1 Tax=unclassified Shimia TaxID=2630038 RepID=UPI001ADC0454|nr:MULTISPECIES: tol-pal system-associated acyl-CoA thioesterase [unclassified Shimia]MBO9396733.1 tol-pal system-associated acyl-CoA thioesterase [Shimia sp. R9_2]MBO9400091.1 tol-pal system-associated acyl-CoA thioesterase [Shimia sp. R9_3]MBO9406595.1 tol-pal system-associated acyl-CoA thioesterase [Shimia sp. R9_1]
MIYTLPVRIYYEDTDMAGIVYYANYLKFIERGRSEWVREIGLDQKEMKDEGIVFVVRRVEADYLGSAVLDDELTVETEVRSVTGVRLTMDQRVKRGEELLFQAVVTVVCMNEAGQPVRLPANIRQMIH